MSKIEIGKYELHVEEMRKLWNRVRKFQYDNPDLCKIPDTLESDLKS